MALETDPTSSSSNGSSNGSVAESSLDTHSKSYNALGPSIDPFHLQLHNSFLRKQTLVKRIQRAKEKKNGHQLDNHSTLPIYFFLKAQIGFTKEDLVKALGLDLAVEKHRIVKAQLQNQLDYLVDLLVSSWRKPLIEFPATVLYYLCDLLAANFKGLFYVPFKENDFRFEWLNRFNCHWVLVAYIDTQYTRSLRSKRPQSSDVLSCDIKRPKQDPNQ